MPAAWPGPGSRTTCSSTSAVGRTRPWAGLTAAIGVLARQGRLPSLWQRIIGVSLLIAVTSVLFHLLTPSEPPRWPELRGGVLGYVLANWLEQSVEMDDRSGPRLLRNDGHAVHGRGARASDPTGHSRSSRADPGSGRRGSPTSCRKASWATRLTAPFQRLAAILPGRRQPALAGATRGGKGGASTELKINPGRNAGAKAEDRASESKAAAKKPAGQGGRYRGDREG